jgi:secreted PhoX family phosphatase
MSAKRSRNQTATDFELLTESAISRRAFVAGGTAFGIAAWVAARVPALAAGRLDFDAVQANAEDTVTVPQGFRWQIVARWGDPMWSDGVPFDSDTRGTAKSQLRAFGDNNDGMALYEKDGRYVLAVNNEYTNVPIMFGNRASKKPESADDVEKGMMAQGVSVIEVRHGADGWTMVKDSPFNRRITPRTPMEITGPASGHALLRTAADPSGTRSLGTWNNCGNGATPWGTYLACEENFNGYFSSSDAGYKPSKALKRYGVKIKDQGYDWARVDERFDVSKNPNEPNRAGYIVEIDPMDTSSTPKKRTALGRFKHENAEVVVAGNGQVVVYMGDDERGEFLYRYISDGRYVAGTGGGDLLDKGRLYVAKFHDAGKGEWIELTPASTGMKDAAEISVHTRQAASAVGATTMDRPEWVAAHPNKAEVYCALTNNKNRGKKPNAGGDATPVGGPNPREANVYGQIVRWRPDGGDHTADTFGWDLFVLAGNPAQHKDARRGSDNVSAANMFNSPDGLKFDQSGLLWIQTDGNYSNKGDFAGQGNNQLLVGDPDTGEIRRFMVGPKECEVTGFAWTPDRKSVFVGIQHPGERGGSHFPDGGNTTPRSCVIAISRVDGRPMA